MLSGARRASSARLFSRPSSRARALQRPPPAASSGSAGCSPPTPRRHAPGRTLLPQGCAGSWEREEAAGVTSPRPASPLPPRPLQKSRASEVTRDLTELQLNSSEARRPADCGEKGQPRWLTRRGRCFCESLSDLVCKKKKKKEKRAHPSLVFPK